MALRRSTTYLALTGTLLLVLTGIFLHASVKVRDSRQLIGDRAELVRRLELTDLSLFTEASYTRHLSMADHSAPFQDAPMSLEHFPTGALAGPPPHLVKTWPR